MMLWFGIRMILFPFVSSYVSSYVSFPFYFYHHKCLRVLWLVKNNTQYSLCIVFQLRRTFNFEIAWPCELSVCCAFHTRNTTSHLHNFQKKISVWVKFWGEQLFLLLLSFNIKLTQDFFYLHLMAEWFRLLLEILLEFSRFGICELLLVCKPFQQIQSMNWDAL